MIEISAENPTAFISYSWDSVTHKDWVRTFATRLRTDGIVAVLDQWEVVPGDQLPQFMEAHIRDSQFVIIICTPAYKKGSNSRIGGVGFEGDIIAEEILRTRNHRKFIPVLRSGVWDKSAPSWLAGKSYIDLSETPCSEDNYTELIRTILGTRTVAPAIGKVPSISNTRNQKFRIEEGYTMDLTINIKESDTGESVAGANILAVFPNRTHIEGTTNSEGTCTLSLYRIDQEMQILVAALGYEPKQLVVPVENGNIVTIELGHSDKQAILFNGSVGYIPGISGRLNPIRDSGGRTYIYANNIAINGGAAQPVHFKIGEELHLIDALGNETSMKFVSIEHEFSLVEYTNPKQYNS